jgi:2-keto-3-deoxy-L-rhamnonate aldolase RhmA
LNETMNGRRLGGEGRLLALITKMPAAATVELAGHAGFDLVMLDTEHGPNGTAELEHHIRAADSAGIGCLVRVGHAGSTDILRALDAGARGIVVPHVKSAEDLERAAALTRYPPTGRRSLAVSTRAGRYGTRTIDEHLAAARHEVVLIAQIEDAESIDNIGEILRAPELDGVFIGPADLSASLGYPGRLDNPVVSDVVDQIVTAVVERPGLCLCVIAVDEAEAAEWVGRGAGLVLFNEPALIATRLCEISEAFNVDKEPRATP